MPKKVKQDGRDLPKHVIERDGKWYIRLHLPTDGRTPTGRKIYTQVVRACHPKTPERATEIINALLLDDHNIRVEAERTKSLESFLQHYLESKQAQVSPRTYSYYSELYRLHLERSWLVKLEIPSISPGLCQRYFNELTTKGVSADMVNRLHSFLSTAFKYALLWREASENPMKGLMLPNVYPAESTALSRDEARRVMEVSRRKEEYLIFDLALETGMRPQECLGLAWDNVHLDEGWIEIVQATVEGVRGGGVHISRPKTRSSRRRLRISSHLVDRLTKHHAAQEKRAKELKRAANRPAALTHHNARKGTKYKERQITRDEARRTLHNMSTFRLVFPASNGKPRSRNNLNRRDFKQLLIDAGIDPGKYSVKHLRHTNASVMAKRLPPKLLQQRLGHKTMSVTLKWYTHLEESDQEAFLESFEKEFS